MAYLADHLSHASHDDRRAQLFRESALEVMERVVLGSAWAMTPARIGGLPGVARILARDLLAPDAALPDPESALDKPFGLAGVVHDFSVPTLVEAYSHGLYPFSHLPPLKWWSPPTRSLLFFKDFHVPKTVRAKLKQGRYTISFDRDFETVIANCAGRRDGRWHLTWITPKIMRAYADAFDAGYVHTFEVRNQAGEMVGGGYGVATGGAFSGESQFSHERDTSKIGMCALNYHLQKWGYHFNDGKLINRTTYDQGFREIPRTDYLSRLAHAVRAPIKPGRWQAEADLPMIGAWDPAACGN